MLEFCKDILLKVSFSPKLFRKELRKSSSWLDKKERLALKTWCLATFGHMYHDVIIEVFRQVPIEHLS